MGERDVDIPDEVAALDRVLDERGIHLRVEAEDERLMLRSWGRIHLSAPEGVGLSIAFCDEYKEATEQNQALLLHFVLDTCECYEETEDFLEWAKEAELDSTVGWVLELYRELGEKVPQIREVVGTEVRALSSWDFSLNAGAAQYLRRRTSF